MASRGNCVCFFIFNEREKTLKVAERKREIKGERSVFLQALVCLTETF